MTDAADRFDSLMSELLREKQLQPNQRSNDFFHATLTIFGKNGIGIAEYEAWRESKMLTSMISVLTRRHEDLNPHLASQREEANLRTFELQYSYSQDINELGMTQLEIDKSYPTLYPNLDRQKLEAIAAEEYIAERDEIKQTGRDESKDEEAESRPRTQATNTHRVEVEGEELSEQALANRVGKPFKTVQSAGNKAAKKIKEQIEQQRNQGVAIGDITVEPIRLTGKGGLDEYALIKKSASDSARTYKKIRRRP
jgi:hypothetical protein